MRRFGRCVLLGALFVLIGLALPKGSDSRSSGSSKRRGLADGPKSFEIRAVRIVMVLGGARLWINNAWAASFPLLLVTGGTSEGAASTGVSRRIIPRPGVDSRPVDPVA